MLDQSLSLPQAQFIHQHYLSNFFSSRSSPLHPCCNHQTPNGTHWTSVSTWFYTSDLHSAVRVSLRKFKSDHVILLFKTLCLLVALGIKSELLPCHPPQAIFSPCCLPSIGHAGLSHVLWPIRLLLVWETWASADCSSQNATGWLPAVIQFST